MKITMGITRETIFEDSSETMRLTVENAVRSGKNLAGANLRGANLRGAKLSGAMLNGAFLAEADMSGADMRGTKLADANLTEAELLGATLSEADLRGAKLSGGIPLVENLDAKILSEIDRGGGLDMSSWHACETTHCRAGWAIVVAGKAGMDLEMRIGPCAAAALIYAVSCPSLPVPNFFDNDVRALADIRARAEASKSEAIPASDIREGRPD